MIEQENEKSGSRSDLPESIPELYYKDDAGSFVALPMEAIADDPNDAGTRMLVMSRTEMQRTHIGPVPDPETIKAYDDIHPGYGARLLDSHLEDRECSRVLAKAEVKNEKWGVIRGQAASFILMAGALSGSVACAFAEHTAVALILGSAPVLTALGRFLGRVWVKDVSDDMEDDD